MLGNYHYCLFEYDQTSDSKSYSMISYGNNKGIVPISCEEIFNIINQNKVLNLHFEIEVILFEIYN